MSMFQILSDRNRTIFGAIRRAPCSINHKNVFAAGFLSPIDYRWSGEASWALLAGFGADARSKTVHCFQVSERHRTFFVEFVEMFVVNWRHAMRRVCKWKKHSIWSSRETIAFPHLDPPLIWKMWIVHLVGFRNKGHVRRFGGRSPQKLYTL